MLGNHLHLIVEAGGREALSRAMQGLAIRLARAINRAQDRSGRVFADHYFGHVLSTPAEVRHAIPYVEENQRVLDLPRRHAEHGRLGHDGLQSLLGPARRLEQPGRELALRPCTR